jgi:pyruvate formate lyase activating enzyme
LVEIKGFVETSLVDWDGKVSAVLFLGGCNFRCPYCHNWPLVLEPEWLANVPWSYVERRLKERRGWIDGVVITGGEPLIHDDLADLLSALRSLGVALKLDTNGALPSRLRKIVQLGLLDCVAVDLKAPLDERYERVAGVPVDLGAIRETIRLLRDASLAREFRTTVVPGLVGVAEVDGIAQLLDPSEELVLQQFVARNAASEAMRSVRPYGPAEIASLLDAGKRHLAGVRFRGI